MGSVTLEDSRASSFRTFSTRETVPSKGAVSRPLDCPSAPVVLGPACAGSWGEVGPHVCLPARGEVPVNYPLQIAAFV